VSTFRVRRPRHYTSIPNDTLRDTKLGLKATGLLALMLSYPDDWEFNQAHLVGLKADGLTAIRAAIKELEAAGYLARTPRREPETGRMEGYDWAVTDTSSHATAPAIPTRLTGVQETHHPVNPMAGEPAPTKTERPTKNERHEQPSVGEADEAAAKTEEPKREEPELSAQIVEIWNAGCGQLTKARVLSAPAEKLIRAEAKRHGRDEFVQLFRAGLPAVRDDDYWLGNRAKRPRRHAPPYGLINYLRTFADKANETLESRSNSVETALPVNLGERWWTHTQGAVLLTGIHGELLIGTVERRHPQHPDGPAPGSVIELSRDDLKVMRAGGSVDRTPF
jgi:hypothetical protein